MTNGIKCGVAGVGYLGKHHARIYDSLDGCELVGILEPDDAAAEKASRAWTNWRRLVKP